MVPTRRSVNGVSDQHGHLPVREAHLQVPVKGVVRMRARHPGFPAVFEWACYIMHTVDACTIYNDSCNILILQFHDGVRCTHAVGRDDPLGDGRRRVLHDGAA